MLNYLSAYVLYPMAEWSQGRRIGSKFRAFRRWMARPFAERRRQAQQRLAEVLHLAGCHVPYYRDLFRTSGFDPDKVERDVAYLQDLPYLDKHTIREQGVRLLHEDIPRAHLELRKTGGSTGQSALIYYSRRALDWTAAANLWALRAIGKYPHTREAHLSSQFPETFAWRDRCREWIKCAAMNRVNIATAALDGAGLDNLWHELRRARAWLLQGHPSTLYALARHIEKRQPCAPGMFQVFESTGESLGVSKRHAIERVFQCRAIDRYGSAEFGVLAYQLSAGAPLTVLDAVAWPETLATSAGPELVFTGLLNEAMPLLRYRTGDLGELSESAQGFSLDQIAGRIHDLVRIGGRLYPTHYVQDLLDRAGGVDEFQIEEGGQRPILRLVTAPATDRQVLASRIREWWGETVVLEFVGFDGLRRVGGRGKFRYVVGAPAAAV